MEMARNKPILSAQCMIVLERPKELAAYRGELLFWATRAHSLHDFCVSVLCASCWKNCLAFRGIFIRVFCHGEQYANRILWLATVDSSLMEIRLYSLFWTKENQMLLFKSMQNYRLWMLNSVYFEANFLINPQKHRQFYEFS